MFDPSLPEELVAHRVAFGPAGIAWLHSLPSLIEECAVEWNLRLTSPFPHLSYNYAAPVVLPNGGEAVLKICPVDEDFRGEATSTMAFDGPASVHLLGADLARGALLLERLHPGTPIRDLPDDAEATAIGVDILRRLWRVPPIDTDALPTLEYWFRGFDNLRALFPGPHHPPRDLLDRCETLVARLLRESHPVLLHGDLNYGNVLCSERGWLAIDPKGVIGDPAFDTAIYLHDLTDRILDAPDPAAFLARRIEIIARATGMDYSRIRDWGIAYAVLSGAWTAEETGSGWDDTIACAEVLFTL
jgi:streptomycin 6-kinase